MMRLRKEKPAEPPLRDALAPFRRDRVWLGAAALKVEPHPKVKLPDVRDQAARRAIASIKLP